VAELAGLRAAYAGRAEPRSARAGRPLPWIVLAGLCAAVVYIAYRFVLAPALEVERVEVSAPAHIDAEAARLRVMALSAGRPVYAVDLDAVERACLEDARVLSARASRSFPRTIKVALEARTAVALVICEGQGRSLPASVDSQGVLFMLDPASALSDLPVISGLAFSGAVEGARLPSALTPVLRQLAASGSGLLDLVSELRVAPKPSGEVELLVYLMGASVPVRMGLDLDESSLRSAALVLDVLKRRGLEASVSEVDLRAGAMVYKSKEDPS